MIVAGDLVILCVPLGLALYLVLPWAFRGWRAARMERCAITAQIEALLREVRR